MENHSEMYTIWLLITHCLLLMDTALDRNNRKQIIFGSCIVSSCIAEWKTTYLFQYSTTRFVHYAGFVLIGVTGKTWLVGKTVNLAALVRRSTMETVKMQSWSYSWEVPIRKVCTFRISKRFKISFSQPLSLIASISLFGSSRLIWLEPSKWLHAGQNDRLFCLS